MDNILVVDDEPDIRELVADILRDEGYSTRLAGTSDEAIAQLTKQRPDLVVLDIWLKDSQMDGIDILKHIKAHTPQVPVVIISGHGNIEIAVAAIKQGAYDFIEKPFNIDQLLLVVRRAVEASQLRQANISLRQQTVQNAAMVGTSAALRAMKTQLKQVVKSNARVLLKGPPGVGKDMAARYIHAHSNRASAPFVAVQCATLDAGGLEETLFGKEAPPTHGLLEAANGGILYLNDVADLPLGTQSKLLQVLVDHTFQRVGGAKTITVDVRIISATARDLPQAIQEGTFREDLYHRLNVVPIVVPSLTDRREDIPLLATHFLAELHETQGLPKRGVSPDALAALQDMDWPANLRQLKNTIERVLIMGPAFGDITPDELPDGRGATTDAHIPLPSHLAALPLREAREVFEREYLLSQINRFDGNISRTAGGCGHGTFCPTS